MTENPSHEPSAMEEMTTAEIEEEMVIVSSEEEPADQSSRVEQSSRDESMEEDLPVTVEEPRWNECPLLHSGPASPSLLHLDGSYSPFCTDFGTSLTRHVT